MMMPMGAPMMMPMGVSQPTGTSFQAVNVKDRTGLGFVWDVIHIPIPWLKPIAVPRPSEVTLQMQQQQQPQTQMVGFSPMAMGTPMMPMAAGMAPMGVAPQMQMVPQASIGYGQVTYASQVPVSQLQQTPAASAPVGAPPAKPTTDQMLEECQRKLEESQKKLKDLMDREAGAKK